MAEALRAQVSAGEPAVLVIEGPPGIGKSRLLEEVQLRATGAGMRTAAGRAFEDQQVVPFAPLLEAVLAPPPICDAAQLRGLSVGSDSHVRVMRAIRDGIDAEARRGPLLVGLDDLHWADAGTTAALPDLIALRGPVFWVFAMRSSGGRPAVRDVVDDLERTAQTAVHRVRLGALHDDAVAEVAADVLSARVDDTVLRLTTMAHGSPFLVLELLNGLGEENRLEIDRGLARAIGSAIPQRLAATMQTRLDRLSPAARSVVQVASTLPERFSASVLARALRQRPTEVLGGVQEAVRADLLIGDQELLRFRHELLRRATAQTIPYVLRRAMERECAAILLESGVAPQEVAAQLARSAEVGDLAAAQALQDAADSVANTDAPAAADLSRQALDLIPPHDPVRVVVATKTIMLLNQARRYDEAEMLAGLSLTDGMSAEREAAIRLTQSVVSRESPAGRARQNRLALQLPGVSPVLRARNLAWLAYNLAGDGQTAAARVAAVSAVGAAEDADDAVALTVAVTAQALVDCADGGQRDCLARLLQAQPAPDSQLFSLVGALVAFDLGNSLTTMGYVSEAVDLIVKALENSRGISAAEQVLEMALAQCELASGRLTAARELVDSALPPDERMLLTLYGAIGFSILASIAAHTDDQMLLREVGIAARAGLQEGPHIRAVAVAALLHSAWQRGDDDQIARWLGEEFDPLASPLWATGIDHLVLLGRLSGASSDAGLRQRLMLAIERLEGEYVGAQPLTVTVARYVRALIDDDVAGIESAAQSLAGSQRPLLHAGAVEDWGHALARRGERVAAADKLGAAFDAYADSGCLADAQRVSHALKRLGVERRVARRRAHGGWDSLTRTELRVVEAVADGATNRQVGDRLGISPHTVNTHLRNIFAKLGVHSRSELVRLARGS
jgi:DNA-binding CsgD family transcriptional regulator/tetratricopeptide (TPR) repeat protein